MNRKLMITALCVVLGCVMLVATVFASSTGTTGYDAYKSALKNTTADVKSFTANAGMTVKDNDVSIAAADMLLKTSKENGQMSNITGSVKTTDGAKSYELYEQNGKAVIKSSDSDIYYVTTNVPFDRPQDSFDFNSRNPESMKAGEAVIDALVGNMKDYFTVVNGPDGGSTVDFRITGSQIPAVVNAVTSLCAKGNVYAPNEALRLEQGNLPSFAKGLKIQAPRLTEDVRVDEISLKADIDNANTITSQKIHVAVSGKDADGKAHMITLDLSMGLSGLNSTTPDTISLEGKQTKTIDKKDFENMNRE